MKKRTALLLAFILSLFTLAAERVTADDFRFLLEREQYHYIQKYWEDFEKLKDSRVAEERKLILEYAQRLDLIDLAMETHYSLARDFGHLEDALQWLLLSGNFEPDDEVLNTQSLILQRSMRTEADLLLFSYYTNQISEETFEAKLQELNEYNEVIEGSAKSLLDEISATQNSQSALAKIDEFYQAFPQSKWHQAVFYLQLSHLSSSKDYEKLGELLDEQYRRSAAHGYIAALFWMSPMARRELYLDDPAENIAQLVKAQNALDYAALADSATVLYDSYSGSDWQTRLKMQKLKILYYKILAQAHTEMDSLYFGDEEGLIACISLQNAEFQELLQLIDEIRVAGNDRGEKAEYYFWKAKSKALSQETALLKEAILDFGQCLVAGSPRNRYDADAEAMISQILQSLNITDSPLGYLRKALNYQSITFEDSRALEGKNYSRVAIADYDNDGLLDLLLNGKQIYKNLGGFDFEDKSEDLICIDLNGVGGLWADFNLDGRLDFLCISHAEAGEGDALMKAQPDGRFVKVNERAGEIDLGFPTEGAAFIDIDGSGYPSLYLANYEKWQERSGFPDAFFHNEKGYFTDKSESLGFHLPEYTTEPGLAGRGVAPADFDNDGKQEILVTNYRLNRNFLFKEADSLFIDVAALYGVAGHYTNGYYGHSIGADWGDIDNDGDLDIFIANLAHPRVIEISDISQLYRNDGLRHRVVGQDTLYYWLFTDITKEAGITYDELHSDPLFFDADNDGFLDLFITSVYENERSYLYRNNGDGSFTDITYLAGARVYNGWGCAAGDLDRDGKLDLVVGSGSGAKILRNITATQNRSLTLKPIYNEGEIDIIPMGTIEMEPHPNSPAFGARIRLWKEDATGNIEYLIRELSSAKGTSSQNAAELHFGLGEACRWGFELWRAAP